MQQQRRRRAKGWAEHRSGKSGWAWTPPGGTSGTFTLRITSTAYAYRTVADAESVQFDIVQQLALGEHLSYK